MKNSTIQPRIDNCLDCGRQQPLTAGRCYRCYWKHRGSLKEKPRFTPHLPISPVSPKQKKRLAKYALVRAEYLAEHPRCEARIPDVCLGLATDIHHVKSRIGDLLTDTRYFKSLCRACHSWVHDNHYDAKNLGLILSKHK